jgi:preprotein translocase subunit SecB
MSIKHKIILNYIKDLSVETPDPESLIVARERISKYGLNLDITSKPLKNKMIEVFTKLIYADKEKSKKKNLF